MSESNDKFVRFTTGRSVYWGRLVNGYVQKIQGSPFTGKIIYQGIIHKLDSVSLLAPCDPSKIICVGLNYIDHAKELGMKLPDEPIIFLKPPTALTAHSTNVVMPAASSRIDYEAELAVIIGKRAKDIPVEEAKEYIFGYTCANDVTARDLQKKMDNGPGQKVSMAFALSGPMQLRVNRQKMLQLS